LIALSICKTGAARERHRAQQDGHILKMGLATMPVAAFCRWPHFRIRAKMRSMNDRKYR